MKSKKNYPEITKIIFLFFLFLNSQQFLIAQSPPTHINAGVDGSTGKQVVINWTYMPPYTTYKIYRANGLAGEWSLVGTKTGVTGSAFAEYTDTYQIQPQTEYCYKIKTCGSNCSDYSYIDCYTTTGLPPPVTWSVSGYITNYGSGIQGVTVSLDGYQTTTNNSGYYILNNVINATTGYLTPFKDGYDFSPTNYYIYNLSENLVNKNFTSSSNSINAPVLQATTNDKTSINLSWTSVAGANYYKVFYNNGNVLTSYIQETSTYAYNLDPNTNYCFYVVAYEKNNGTGMVSPNSNIACATTTNNTSYIISGTTEEMDGTIIPYSEVTFTNLSSVVSNGNGSYTKDVQVNWSGTISANKSGYTFQSYNISNVNQNLPSTNIIGTAISQNALISVSPTNLSFGDITIGGSSSVQTFEITNTGTDPLIVTGVNSSNEFDITGFTSGTINPGISKTTGVTFSPTAEQSYNKVVTVVSNASNNDNEVNVSGVGIIGGNCIYSDVPADHYAYDAVNYLCDQGLLDDDGYCEPEDPITRAALAKLAYLSIGLQQNPVADDFPSPFQDLQDETTWFYTYAKNLSYLEYQDGIAPFDKTFFNFYASNNISRAHALKVLIETWDIPVQTGTGLPFTDVPVNHDAYKYIYTAFQLGIISDNPDHIFGPNVPIYRGEVFVMLYKIMDVLETTVPVPTEEDFFIPGNYTPDNFASFDALHSGNFNFYTKTSFAISSIGIPLSFEHTYNSYLTEMPEGLTPLKPLGKAWNHPYNSYIMEVPGDIEVPGDFRVVIALPNSGFQVYKLVNGSYICETKGVYNTLQKPTSDKFTVTTKNQIVYTYQKIAGSADNFPYVLKTVHDRNGNTITVNYESSSYKSGFFRIKDVTGTAGRKLNFYYHNATDLINYITDPIGRSIYFTFNTYDVLHDEPKLTSFKDAKGHFTYYNYGTSEEELYLLLSIQLPKGNVITNTYNQKKLISTQTNNAQPTTFNYTRNYGQSGDLNYTHTTVTDPLNNKTSIDFNRKGNPNYIQTDAATVNISYNSVQTTKPDNIDIDGKTISYTYDNKGNVLSMNLPMSISHQFQYNNFNDITQYTDPRRKIYSYDYDGNGNLSSVTTPRGTSTINHNSKGLVTSTNNPSGITVNYSYDSYGNLNSTSAPEGITTNSSYDLVSRMLSFTNPNGQLLTYNYDANDNLTSETLSGSTTQYGYDLNNNLTSIINAKGGITSMTYDFDNDYLLSMAFGENTDQYTYDNDGRLSTHTDPKGQVFTNFYDTQNRLQSVSTSGESVSYTYDENDNIATITNASGTISFDYDALNRVTQTTDFWGNIVEYTYDAASNITSIIYPDNKTVKYTYADDNLLNTVTDWNNNTTSYTYRADGLLIQVDYPNGSFCTYDYDNAGRMTGMSWKKSDAGVINEYAFTLDPMGNHLSEQKTEPYTPITQNSQSIAYAYNSVNRITKAGSTDFSFDANGNTTGKGSNTYQYNKFDQLTSVSGNINMQYLYDGNGNRRQRIQNGETTRYILDLMGMTNVLMETDGSGNPKNYYIYGLGLISRIDANNNTAYYHYDFRGSTIAMTDENQNITHKYQYDDYGNILQNEEVDFNAFRYVGKYGIMYESPDLYFMRARYYDPEIGRFICEDPVWSNNLYPYVGNNPVIGSDPKGTNLEIVNQGAEMLMENISGFGNSTANINHALIVARQVATNVEHIISSANADANLLTDLSKLTIDNGKKIISGGGGTSIAIKGAVTTSSASISSYGIGGVLGAGGLAVAGSLVLLNETNQIIKIINQNDVGFWKAFSIRANNVGAKFDLTQYF